MRESVFLSSKAGATGTKELLNRKEAGQEENVPENSPALFLFILLKQ